MIITELNEQNRHGIGSNSEKLKQWVLIEWQAEQRNETTCLKETQHRNDKGCHVLRTETPYLFRILDCLKN